jgi:hypothetical protein
MDRMFSPQAVLDVPLAVHVFGDIAGLGTGLHGCSSGFGTVPDINDLDQTAQLASPRGRSTQSTPLRRRHASLIGILMVDPKA